MKRTPIQRLARHFDLDLLRVVRRLEAELIDTTGVERIAWTEANIALHAARNHVRSIMSDEDRRAGV